MTMNTKFAPAERAPAATVKRQSLSLRDDPRYCEIIEAMPHIVMILNPQRQIVYANRVLLESLGLGGDFDAICGLRPGEALRCIRAGESDNGCGTTEFCTRCGAVSAILAGLTGKETSQECRIIDESGAASDFLVWAKPLDIDDTIFVALSILDISHEKRRHVLERIFFHDVMNTATGIKGFADLTAYTDPSPEEMKEKVDIIRDLSEMLIGEINAQKLLLDAENDDLDLVLDAFSAKDFVTEMMALFINHEMAKGRNIVVDPASGDAEMVSDRTLLQRVVGNMIKNALEASKPGETVTLASLPGKDTIRFTVHNAAAMTRDAQLQIFQRSFSTKGAGRGLGTYSMKLLTTRYLEGDVTFTSNEADGTTFEAVYPLGLTA